MPVATEQAGQDAWDAWLVIDHQKFARPARRGKRRGRVLEPCYLDRTPDWQCDLEPDALSGLTHHVNGSLVALHDSWTPGETRALSSLARVGGRLSEPDCLAQGEFSQHPDHASR